MRDITIPGGRPGPALLLAVLLSGCGGAGSGQDQAALQVPEGTSLQSAGLRPVERPVARPMDRGRSGEASRAMAPVERPVARPMDRGLIESGQGS